ncbi:MAG: hypothetical protein K8S23_03355 [Candidatus Cloacimonetes bacterium]|nr:hypothetical protein [Candidatus Cloacimonadota bacterium]
MHTVRIEILKEIELLPEEKLNEIYELIHFFRLGLQRSKSKNKSIMDFAGIWKDLSDKDFNEFSHEMKIRRKNAFNSRRDFEASND